MKSLLLLALGLARTVVLGARIEAERIVVSVRPYKREQRRCPVCGRACDFYDMANRGAPRLWRAMDLARSACYLEYAPCRVRCPEHGVRTEAVPWARHGARFTRDFEDWVAWLAVRCTASAVSELARVEWHSVGGVCRRVYAELEAEEVRALEEEAASIKGSRYALVKNPEDLTDGQRARLEALKKRAGSRLGRAWELKEDLRAVFRAADGSEAAELLDDWMHRAAYCKIAKVVAVEKKVRRRRDDIIAAVELGISNGRVEAINNKIKVTVRMGYGFRNTDNLVALLMLRCGDCQPQLPGRPVKARKKGVKGAKSVAA